MKQFAKRLRAVEVETGGKQKPIQTILYGSENEKTSAIARLGDNFHPDNVIWIQLVGGEFPERMKEARDG